jgi:hypothetical protein
MGQRFLNSPAPSFILHRVVPFVMVPLPLVDVLLKRTVSLEGMRGVRQAERIRDLQHKLWIGTGVGLGIVVLTQMWLPDFRGLAWIYPFILLHVLFARPLIQVKNPMAKGDAFMPQTTRAASLEPRHRASTLARWAWFLGLGVWSATALLCLWLLASVRSWYRIEDTLGFLLSASLPLVIAPAVLRWWLQRPEPMDPAGTPALSDAYARLRRIKAWCCIGSSLIWVSLFLAMALLCASGYSSLVGHLWFRGMPAGAGISFILGLVYTRERLKVGMLLRELVAKAEAPSRE